MSITDNVTELLISKVKKYPILYNMTLPDSKNLALKKSVWQEIANEIGVKNGEIVNCKWKNLRDCYLKHRKSVLNPQLGERDRKLLHWRWSPYMSFMDPYIKVPRNLADTDKISEAIETLDTEDLELELSDVEETKYVLDNKITLKRGKSESPENDCGSNFYSTSRSPENQEKRRRYIEIDEVAIDPYPRWNPKGLDKVDHLFLSYAETFKKLSPRRQVLMKLKMAEIFAKAELEEIERDPIGYDNNDDSS